MMATPAALADNQVITTADVEELVVEMSRSGTLPVPPAGVPAGRQLRRWATQVLVLEALLLQEAQRMGPTGPEGEGKGDAAASFARSPAGGEELPAQPASLAPGPMLSIELGTVVVAVLARSPAARAVYEQVTACERVSPDEVASYMKRNSVKGKNSTQLLVRQWRSGRAMNQGRPFPVLPTDFPPETGERLCAAADGESLCFPDGSTIVLCRRLTGAGQGEQGDQGDEIADLLLHAKQRAAFGLWAASLVRERAVFMPGYEHPGDPSQPDSWHNH